MIKGTSRQIVEVSDAANPYFERAFFIVREQCREASPALLDKEARRLVNTSSGYSGLQRARRARLWQRCGWLLTGAGVGIVLFRVITAFL